MAHFVKHLLDSTLVSRFQNSCGLFATEPDGFPPKKQDSESTSSRGVRSESNTRNGFSGNGTGASEQPRSNAKRTHDVSGRVVKSSSPKYVVKNYFLYYLFRFAAALGQEVFYITFLPCTHWNMNPFLCRRLVNMWAVIMYIGQVTKDLLKWPRPFSPPVVKLEPRVDAEYGMPSTHAMAATSISFTFLLSTMDRYQYPFELGLMAAILFSTLVCLSRLYVGMHSVLDVICGVLIAGVVMAITYPVWDTFDHLQVTSPYSPIIAVVLPYLMSHFYPRLDHYSTTRGDTTIILGSAAGCSIGYWVNHQLGETYEPTGGFPLAIPAMTLAVVVYSCVRFAIGIAFLVVTRQVMKSLSLFVLCSWFQVSKEDRKARQRLEIEVPYKFVTYSAVGITSTVLVHKTLIILGLF
ncbi:sphingosine-1-phosphate phosphatase 2 isoform X1 [Amia ocellicauda]|uniref:sphingosine-1-phosphate phosphatase 2 isoform X1 n=1 Tax=Amia ocellicauda TaxID=2972642 RepID=UPI003463A4E8